LFEPGNRARRSQSSRFFNWGCRDASRRRVPSRADGGNRLIQKRMEKESFQGEGKNAYGNVIGKGIDIYKDVNERRGGKTERTLMRKLFCVLLTFQQKKKPIHINAPFLVAREGSPSYRATTTKERIKYRWGEGDMKLKE